MHSKLCFDLRFHNYCSSSKILSFYYCFVFYSGSFCAFLSVAIKILDSLQEPWKGVTKSMDIGQTKTAQGQYKTARTELAAPTGPARIPRFTHKTGNNDLLTVIRQLVNSNIAGNQSTRFINTLIRRKVNYMKQHLNCRIGFLSLNV